MITIKNKNAVKAICNHFNWKEIADTDVIIIKEQVRFDTDYTNLSIKYCPFYRILAVSINNSNEYRYRDYACINVTYNNDNIVIEGNNYNTSYEEIDNFKLNIPKL